MFETLESLGPISITLKIVGKIELLPRWMPARTFDPANVPNSSVMTVCIVSSTAENATSTLPVPPVITKLF